MSTDSDNEPPVETSFLEDARNVVWSERSKAGKIGVCLAALVGFGLIVTAVSPPDSSDEAPVATGASMPAEVAVTDPPATTVPATVAPPVTEMQADAFAVWLIGKFDTFESLPAQMNKLAESAVSGDVVIAVQLARDLAGTYFDLYVDAPETGTDLSNTGNEWLLSCYLAFDASATALETFDVDGVNAASELVMDCTRLLEETTGLL